MAGPDYTEKQAREAIAASRSWAEAMRRLSTCWTGGSTKVLRRWAGIWKISTDHFDPNAARREALYRPPRPLEEILVVGSAVNRHHLKERLYREGLKRPECEECGQGEIWQGRRMSLILDHRNGMGDDNRLENLRIVCPNCAATLDTHCGRRKALDPERTCLLCNAPFRVSHVGQIYCSLTCAGEANRDATFGVAQPERRKVERPPYQQLVDELRATNYSAVGRKYGVSDNAIRKWVRQYEREAAVGKIDEAA